MARSTTAKAVKVLVVDDSVAFARAASDYLAQHPHLEVLPPAVSGDEALERVPQERPDLVLMDVNMPLMDGLEATARVKARAPATKVVLVSLEGFPPGLDLAHKSSGDAFLAKSELGERLEPLIARLFNLNTTFGSAPMNKTAHILLVEDNRMDVELTLDAFRESRLTNTVHVADGGSAALDYLEGAGAFADRKKYPLPDLILLDLKMPIVDGHEVLRRIKQQAPLRRIPVVVLSSSKEEGDLAMTYDNGANSFLVKPVSFEGFLDVVKRIDEYWLTLNVAAPLGAV